jgi:hypothetical protein
MTTKMLGKIISPEQSKKMNDFATGVANKKQRLRIRNGFMSHIMGHKFITYLCP